MTEPQALPPAPVERQRLVAIDLLRFLAAFAVVLYHYVRRAPGDPSPGAVATITEHGYLGVNLFFIISGFVVLWSAQGRSARAFVRSRVLRLYPEFWIAVIVSAVAFNWFGEEFGRTIDMRTALLNLTMIPQYLGAEYVDGVYWTLGVEIKFYLLVFLLLLLGRSQDVERWLWVWLLLAVLVRYVGLGPVRLLVVHPNGPLFIAGCAFYLVRERGWTRGRGAMVLACLALAIDQAILDMSGWVDASRITTASRVGTALAIVAFFAAFTWVVAHRWEPRQARRIVALGALTYPLYLLHNVGKAIFLDGSFPVPSLAIPAAIVFSVLLSLAVTYLAERWVTPPLRVAITRLLGDTRRRSTIAPAVVHPTTTSTP